MKLSKQMLKDLSSHLKTEGTKNMESLICLERITSSEYFKKGMFYVPKRKLEGSFLAQTAGFWQQYMNLCKEIESVCDVPVVIKGLYRKVKGNLRGNFSAHWYLDLAQAKLANIHYSPNSILQEEKIPRSVYINFANSIKNICACCGGYKSSLNPHLCEECWFLNSVDTFLTLEEEAKKWRLIK